MAIKMFVSENCQKLDQGVQCPLNSEENGEEGKRDQPKITVLDFI